MKILIFNTNIGYGGASKMLTFVANTLGDAGHEVHYITYRNAAILQTVSQTVQHIHITIEDGRNGLLASIKTISVLHRYIKEGEFDVAIAFLSPSQLRLAVASCFTKVKVIFSLRSDPYAKGKSRSFRAIAADIINAITFKMADYYVFQTEMARDYFPESIRRISRVIANPIKPLIRTEKRTESSIKKTIVTVGRHEIKQKRQDVLIEAFNIFNKTHQDYILEIYGDGEDSAQIEELAKSNPNIILCGATRNVAEKIQNASMFVLTSDYEGIPNALLEAMSIGVPCISTDCSPGGASMLINSKDKGIVVECGNALKVAEAMVFMADNPLKAELMGSKAMYVNDEYSPAKIASMWLEVVSGHVK